MLDLKSFTQAIQQIADEKGIPRDKIIETIEMALSSAYKRDYGKRGQIVQAKMDPASGKVTMKQVKIVVDENMLKSEEEIAAEEAARNSSQGEGAGQFREKENRGWDKNRPESEREEMENPEERKVRFNPEKHLMLEDAQKIKPDAMPGDELEFSLEHHDEYGRIAAQTAKQVIIQRIREIEREVVFDEYKNKEGEVLGGLIQRIEGHNVFVDLGRTVGVLPPEEQLPREYYHVGERIKALVTLVEKNTRGPSIFLSRTHPKLLKKLFEIEVPEIASKAVEIKAIAREAGSRSKIAVASHQSGIDPVGSLVGQKGVRVSTVINELGGEKIDVIEWSDEPDEFIANALSPAKVLAVELNENMREARAIVPEEQLSLAIGKGGQNVRLAAKLTGWKIDVQSSQNALAKDGKEAPEKNPVEEDGEKTSEESAVTEDAPAAEKAAEDNSEN